MFLFLLLVDCLVLCITKIIFQEMCKFVNIVMYQQSHVLPKLDILTDIKQDVSTVQNIK